MMEESGKRASSMGDGDRLSGLPDELLHRVLSFLPAQDAVRTCVLAPRWHHLWESAPRLNVHTMGFASIAGFTQFVSNLLLRRDHAPLDAFWLRADGPHIFLDDFPDTANLWIYHALRCNVQALGIVDYWHDESIFYPDRRSFTSSHLKRLHLCSVAVGNCFIKQLFSGCPLLEDLEMIDCDITATEFSSTTLKSLIINNNIEDMVIDMPSLVSLYIGALDGTKPSFMNLQSLLTASISIEYPWRLNFSVGCYILRALSNARNLELLSTYSKEEEEFLGNDKLFCQVVFTNLTTLSLGIWCLHHSCKALLYVLKQSPNLEKLTLMLSGVRHSTAKIDPPCKGRATPFNCAKLQKIEIICPKRDKKVVAVVAILCANLISIPEINIKPSRDTLSERINGHNLNFCSGLAEDRDWQFHWIKSLSSVCSPSV